jgi:selenocysteine lyase/cysteine desulfurase
MSRRACVRGGESADDGKPLVYLDNAATTQKPRAVIDRLSRFYAEDSRTRAASPSWFEAPVSTE